LALAWLSNEISARSDRLALGADRLSSQSIARWITDIWHTFMAALLPSIRSSNAELERGLKSGPNSYQLPPLERAASLLQALAELPEFLPQSVEVGLQLGYL
jgi:hypothetical protein